MSTRKTRYEEKLDEYAAATDGKINPLISSINDALAKLNVTLKTLDSVETSATASLGVIKEAETEILDFYKQLTEGDEADEVAPIIDYTNEANEKIGEVHQKAIDLEGDLFGKSRKIKKITATDAATLSPDDYFEKDGSYFKIIAKATQGASQRIKALESEITDLKKSIEDSHEKAQANKNTEFGEQLNRHQAEFLALQEEVKKFLPTAMSAGLSEAYRKTTEHHKKSESDWRKWFTYSIVAMVALAAIAFGINVYNETSDPLNIFVNFLKLAPIEAPLIWFAYIASKRIKQEARLHEEHLHKWSVAFSFEGLIKAAKDIDGKESDLQSDVIRKFVSSYSKNPGFVIDVKGKDSPAEALASGAKDFAKDAVSIVKDTVSPAEK